MSTESKSSKQASTWTHRPRVASFTVKTENNKRVFTPVNDRAKKLAKKLGKRTRVSTAELKPFAKYYKLRQYNNAGKLVAVRV